MMEGRDVVVESDERELSLFEAEERYLETDGLGVGLSESVSLGVIGEDYRRSMSTLMREDRRANILAPERGPGPRLPPKALHAHAVAS